MKACVFTAILLAVGLHAGDRVFPGTQGAIRIPMTVPREGRASVGIYTKSGRLVRILGQGIDVKQGRYTVLWDGMDLWGNLLPAGGPYKARLIFGPGVKAFYEFTAAQGDVAADHVPWLTAPMGKGMDMRTGGWLGDHTGPGAAAAIGDKVFLGSRLVEHGHALIAVDLQGRKLWGTHGLEGWGGPDSLYSDGKAVIARCKNNVYRIDAETYERRLLFGTGKNKILNFAVSPGRVHIITRAHIVRISPFQYAFRHPDIDFAKAVPQMLGTKAPDYQIPASKRFSTVFVSHGGHFQTGLDAVMKRGTGHVVVPLKKAASIGTIALPRLTSVALIEIFALKKGVRYDAMKHSPTDRANGDDDALGLDDLDIEMEMQEFDPNWQLIAKAKPANPVNYITPKTGKIVTNALYLRFTPVKDKGATPKKIHLQMCRLYRPRLEPVTVKARVLLPRGAKARRGSLVQSTSAGVAWNFRTPANVRPDKPVYLTFDYGKAVSFHGLAFLNHTMARYDVEALTKDIAPGAAQAEDWELIREFKSRSSKKYGYDTASTRSRSYILDLMRQVQTRAIRLKIHDAYRSGRVQLKWTGDDPQRIDCAHMIPVRLAAVDKPKDPDPHAYEVYNSTTGKRESRVTGKLDGIIKMAVDAAGTIYTTSGTNLQRSRIEGGVFKHQVLNRNTLSKPGEMIFHGDQLVVGDREQHAIYFFDKTGKVQRQVGGKLRQRGKWDPDHFGKISGIAIDTNNRIWLAEAWYSPKRVARFDRNGRCEWEVFGPPQYGGGGWLDPNLKSFYYRGVEYGLDWDQGRSGIRNINDRIYTEETPAMDAGSFGYTQIGRPTYINGKRYVVGDAGAQFGPGLVVCLLEGRTWKPCFVMGKAKGSVFLTRKAKWKQHWLSQELDNKLFMWNDRNEDGDYQVEEVDLFPASAIPGNPADGGYWGTWSGPDLTFWSRSARLTPSRFGPKGTPIYERTKIQAFSYKALAPTYTGNEMFGSRAKPGPGKFSLVCHDGSLIICGQPYRVLKDMTIAGGPVTAKPSDFIPPINGKKIHYALHYAGSAVTKSPVGEVAMTVGDAGVWTVVSVKDRMVLDHVFTGADGGWSTDLKPVRGADVTGRRHGGETFFGHFIKAQNGNYYTVAGKGFHGICRIEGLDDYQVSEANVSVTPAAVAKNQKLRQLIIRQHRAMLLAAERKRLNKQLTLRPAAALTKPKLKLDGDCAEIRDQAGLQPLDEQYTPQDPKPKFYFGAVSDSKGIYLAYRGISGLGNNSEDPRFLFKTGFCFDFRYRLNGEAKRKTPVAGDRRIVFGRHQGKWIAVLYDYVNPDVPEDQAVVFASPVVTTTVARVAVLPADPVRIRFVDDILDLDDFAGDKAPKGKSWSAEVFVPWTTLGFKQQPDKLRADAGVMIPDSGGQTVIRRVYWSNNGFLACDDLGVEARIQPGTWGALAFGTK